MASISSLMGSSGSTSSIYGNRNIISGLASGMDTEALIENCIKSYQLKISKLQQQQTKVTWKQDAYRSITDKLLSISQKYTSYTSKTNLSSRSFFLNSVNTTTNGINASKVSATGRTNSEIKINAVKQLASAARYSTDATVLETKASVEGMAVDFDEKVQLTKLSGDITLTVGGNKVSLSFDNNEIIKDADELAAAINQKLSETELGTAKASTRVKAVNNGGTIRFETIGDSKTAGDAAWISSAYGDIKDTLGITAGALGKGDTSLSVSGKEIYEEVDRRQYLSNKTVDIKIGDKTAHVFLGDLTDIKDNQELGDYICSTMTSEANKVFGAGTVGFEFKDGSFVCHAYKDKDGNIPAVDISSSAGIALGFGSSGLSNAMSTSSTLGQVFGKDFENLCGDTGVSMDPSKWVASEDATATAGVTKDDRAVEKKDAGWYRADGTKVKDADIIAIAGEAKDGRVVEKKDAWYRENGTRVDDADITATAGKAKDGKAVEKKDDGWYYADGTGTKVAEADVEDITATAWVDRAGEAVEKKNVWFYKDDDTEVADADVADITLTACKDKNGKALEKKEAGWYYENGTKVADADAADITPTAGVDKDGNAIIYKQGAWFRKPDKADLVINGVNVGSFDKNSTIEEVLSKINSSEAGVKASYSKLTNKFVFTANETGSQGKIEISGALGEALFGKTEVGKAEVNTDEVGVVTDSDGKALAVTENGQTYYLMANYDKESGKVITEPDGSVKYFKAKKNDDGKFSFMVEEVYDETLDDIVSKRIEVSMENKDVLNTLKQARKGYEEGKDAIFNATVNGDNVTLTRSSNVVDMDGMTVTLNDVFNNEKDANGVSFFNDDNTFNKGAKLERDSIVTFTTKADADKILEAVQAFITEFNEIATQVRTEYSTTPLKNSSKKNYEPLTDEDREGMTETQIKEYEEKAKTGLLFGDTDLSGLHNSLRNAITPSGDLRKAMSEIGLTVKYENGITTLSLDESKFRAALDKDIDGVQKVFTASQENGDSYDGLMARTKKTIDTYASTSIGSYGILVRKAGTTSKALSLRDNTLQKQYNNLEDQIERWQNKMSDKVDYYTKQFTKLEQLMNQMNSQSSTLASLTGGYY